MRLNSQPPREMLPDIIAWNTGNLAVIPAPVGLKCRENPHVQVAADAARDRRPDHAGDLCHRLPPAPSQRSGAHCNGAAWRHCHGGGLPGGRPRPHTRADRRGVQRMAAVLSCHTRGRSLQDRGAR